MSEIRGKVWNFGDNIDTDVIIPGRYLRTFDPKDLALHVLEGEREDFTKNVQQGDVILAGENFGCGSSREQAPVAIKAAGVETILLTLSDVDDAATGFLMTNFYRNLMKGMSKRESLKEAQLLLRTDEKFKSFNYWGSFIMID